MLTYENLWNASGDPRITSDALAGSQVSTFEMQQSSLFASNFLLCFCIEIHFLMHCVA